MSAAQQHGQCATLDHWRYYDIAAQDIAAQDMCYKIGTIKAEL